MKDIGLLMIKHETVGQSGFLESTVLDYVISEGFTVLETLCVDNLYSVMPLIYSDDSGNPLHFVERDIASRKKLFGDKQTATVYILEHRLGETTKKLNSLVGPTSFEEYERTEYSHTLRARFLGPKIIEVLEEGEPKEVRIDAFHCTRTEAELLKEMKIFFDPETIQKYD